MDKRRLREFKSLIEPKLLMLPILSEEYLCGLGYYTNISKDTNSTTSKDVQKVTLDRSTLLSEIHKLRDSYDVILTDSVVALKKFFSENNSDQIELLFDEIEECLNGTEKQVNAYIKDITRWFHTMSVYTQYDALSFTNPYEKYYNDNERSTYNAMIKSYSTKWNNDDLVYEYCNFASMCLCLFWVKFAKLCTDYGIDLDKIIADDFSKTTTANNNISQIEKIIAYEDKDKAASVIKHIMKDVSGKAASVVIRALIAERIILNTAKISRTKIYDAIRGYTGYYIGCNSTINDGWNERDDEVGAIQTKIRNMIN
ncbi:MAG: hypothetical protein SNI70_12760 [Rikenellaceae bacterium]